MKSADLSFLTVTYWNDFDLLKQQLDSFDQFYSSKANHLIVLNDSRTHLEELESIVRQHTKHHYQIFHREEIYNRNICSKIQCDELPGWYSQQVLKLFASAVVESEFYCVLDSKNYFTLPSDDGNFVKHGMAVNTPESECNILGEFSICSENSYRLLEAPFDTKTLVQSIPPVVFKTVWVKDLLNYLVDKNLSLAEIILWYEGLCCTEFYLYSAWLSKNNLSDQVAWILDKRGPVAYDALKSKRRP